MAFCGMCMASSMAQVTLNIDAGQRGASIGGRHYGIFFEEINHAGDGGLYAELIRNRSFEDNASSPEYWSKVGTAELKLVSAGLLGEAQSKALEVKIAKAGDGVANEGYWGINAVANRRYDLSLWIKGPWTGTLTATLTARRSAQSTFPSPPPENGKRSPARSQPPPPTPKPRCASRPLSPAPSPSMW